MGSGFPSSAVGVVNYPIILDPSITTQTSTQVINQPKCGRVIAGSKVCTRIGMEVQTQSGNMNIGIFQDNGAGAPGALILQSGSVVVPAGPVGYWNLPSGLLIAAGMWIAVMTDNATASFGCAFNPGLPQPPLWRNCSWNQGSFSYTSNPVVGAGGTTLSVWGE